MGLDINAVRFLIDARRRGIDFGEVLTLGRQDLNFFPAKMIAVLEAHGFPATAFKGDATTLYAEPCFLSLGAKKVHSLDASDFEGATFVQDLNQPLGAGLKERFDLVVDGGTLEHVFNFPLALQSCMEMVKPGGHLLFHTCANNWCGHGFYQFSPELFYRALSPENGFEISRMILHRVGPYGGWHEVADPNAVRARVELVSLAPMQLLVLAKRTRVTPIFARAPQQSDYTPRWEPAKAGDPPPINYEPPRPWISTVLPGVARLLNVLKNGLGLLRTHTLWNRRSYRPVSKP
jgi:SAM-dependent methyltransferase